MLDINVAGSIARSIALSAVDVLNEALAMDREAITGLVNNYQLSMVSEGETSPVIYVEIGGKLALGMLGVINGIIERQSGEIICAVYEPEYPKRIAHFALLSDVQRR